MFNKKIALSMMACSVIYANSDLNLINANDLQVFGNGVVIGIADSVVRKTHVSLKDKVVNEKIYKDGEFSVETHGSHVASIAVGNVLDANKPRGVATKAKIYAFQNTSQLGTINPKIYDYFKDKDVKIINNSWGSNLYPTAGLQHTGLGSTYQIELTKEELLSKIGDSAKGLIKLSQEKNILSVFAAGNEGMPGASIQASMPYYDESLRSWLVVGALNSAGISKNQNGKIVISKDGIFEKSNHFRKAGLFSIMAPGTNINAAYSRNDNDFIKMSGTSMAAPFVSGVAALVQEKFPFLNGKQIADVILSTANSDFEFPSIIVKTIPDGSKVKYGVIYIDKDVPKDENTIRNDLNKAGYDANKILKNKYEDYDAANSLTNLNTNFAIRLSKEEVFGQGILDAKKALNGLALLDINRMSDSDVKTFLNNQKEAYYTIDTADKISVFSNDMDQRKWDDKYHRVKGEQANGVLDEYYNKFHPAQNLPQNLRNLNAGLIKDGSGTLRLEGDNKYQGLTVIQNGTLNISKRADGSGGVISGGVLNQENGIVAGNGVIKGAVLNRGTFMPGNDDLDKLKIENTYAQEGQNSKIVLSFDKRGNSNLEANRYDIKGGTLEYRPLQNEFYAIGHKVQMQLGGLKEHLDKFSGIKIYGTQTLDFVVSNSDKSIINEDKNLPYSDLIPLTPAEKVTPLTPLIPANKVVPLTVLQPAQKIQNDDVLVIKPVLKPNAYETEDSTIGSALRGIRTRNNLSSQYQEIFAKIDSGAGEILDSISQSGVSEAIPSINQPLYELSRINILSILKTPSTQSFAVTLAKNPIYVAGLSDEMLIKYVKDTLDNAAYKNTWYITPKYKKYNNDKFNGKSVGSEIGFYRILENSDIVGFGLNYLKSDLNFRYSNIKSDALNAVFSYSFDMKDYKILSGLGFGIGNNDVERKIHLVDNKISANYKNSIFLTQLGLAKDFVINDLVITPIGYLNAGFITQDAFNESGAAFAKSYDRVRQNVYSAVFGFDTQYHILDNQKLTFSVMYEKILSGKNIKSRAKFVDFAGYNFEESTKLIDNNLQFNADWEILLSSGVFFKLGGNFEYSKNQNNFSAQASFGYRF
ncbi:S8 family serine peptidase [Campylobacter majalis]|uniref:S8 family serine peptidase n=1 Tax=Campylobacter majalis TaxID=2790656 RepID=UPI003D695F73